MSGTDIGRTALALATAERLHDPENVLHPAADEAADAPESPRPWYDEAERKQVRNRLIALGAMGGSMLFRRRAGGGGAAGEAGGGEAAGEAGESDH